jgi:hypothetical protein
MESCELFSWLSSNHDPPDFSLPSTRITSVSHWHLAIHFEAMLNDLALWYRSGKKRTKEKKKRQGGHVDEYTRVGMNFIYFCIISYIQ